MKLLTKAITDKLPKLYATENVPEREKVAIAKFFTPTSGWTWWVIEGEPDKYDSRGREPDNPDWLFFGLVKGLETEYGYFRLSDLEAVKGPFGLGIERDIHFRPTPLATILANLEFGA